MATKFIKHWPVSQAGGDSSGSWGENRFAPVSWIW